MESPVTSWIPAEPSFGAFGYGSKPPVPGSVDLDRVLSLPRRPQIDLSDASPAARLLVEVMNDRLRRPDWRRTDCKCRGISPAHPCITSLKPAQAWALYEAAYGGGGRGGLLALVATGGGKCGIGLLMPLAMPGCKLAVGLMPANLVQQCVREYLLWREHFYMPNVRYGDQKGEVGDIGAGRGRCPTLHLHSFNDVSNPKNTELLSKLNPDLLYADEMDKLANLVSTRTGRFLRVFRTCTCGGSPTPDTVRRGPGPNGTQVDWHHPLGQSPHPLVLRPPPRFCGWSGTPVDKSVLEYAHLAAFALGYGSPLPLDTGVAKVWAEALDPGECPAPEGALKKLRREDQTLLEGFGSRLVETLGVVATQEGAISIPLRLYERTPRAIPAEVKDMVRSVRAFKRPDGEELVDALEVARVVCEVAQGFFYRWKFPTLPRGVDGKLTPGSIEQILAWLAARKAWRAEVRDKLKENRPHLDSEKLLRDAARRHHAEAFKWLRPDLFAQEEVLLDRAARAKARLDANTVGVYGQIVIGDDLTEDELAEAEHVARTRRRDLPTWASETYLEWARVEDTCPHETESVWVSDYLAEDAAEWSREHRGVIWYKHVAFGQRVAELAKIPMYGGGPDAERRIMAERGHTSIVASIDSHGRGRDGLQYLFNEQLCAHAPASGRMTEQVFARLHRVGQPKPEVNSWHYRHFSEMADAFDRAVGRAEFARDTWGASQKVLEASCAWRDR